jgi:capsular exopolysaccharide synthesis family protein
MSRIDEALRRVSGEAVQVDFDRAKGRSVAEEMLERYPTEGPAARQPKIDREVSAPASHRELAPGVLIAPRSKRRQFGQIDPEIDGKIVTGHPTHVAVEQYRRLAATLHELQVERGIKTLMITSAVPREGKTLTATNLALTFSESYGLKVLLIDADLRRPSVHEIFKLPNKAGLSDGLRSEKGPLPLIEISDTLSVLTAGRPSNDPMAGLTSERMKAVVEEATARFDWVIIDTPPVGLLPDAQLLARLADGALVVIGAGKTPYTLVQRVINELGSENIIGTVLNRVEEGLLPATGYYKEYYGVPEGQERI